MKQDLNLTMQFNLIKTELHRPTMCSFPLILNGSFKDVKQYAARKEIEIEPAFKDSVIAYNDELSEKCIHAKSLLLRCAHFPLYPRLTHAEAAKIAKVLGTLP